MKRGIENVWDTKICVFNKKKTNQRIFAAFLCFSVDTKEQTMKILYQKFSWLKIKQKEKEISSNELKNMKTTEYKKWRDSGENEDRVKDKMFKWEIKMFTVLKKYL